MKTLAMKPWWLGVGLAIAWTGLAVPSTQANSLRLDVQMSKPLVLAGAPQTAYVYVALTGVEPREGRRAPLNVAIVLDRSGSMAGRKIAEARRAAIMAIGQLRDDDIVSVVTYESTVDVLVPATKVRDRERIFNAIRSIGPGGNTSLFAGVSKGAQELRKFLTHNRVNTLILLSDGLANVGPSSPGELGQLGASLAREGMAVTTIGLGLDYNEDLMTRLAMSSDGNHFFVEDEADLEYAFSTEFGDALSAVAQRIDLHIHCLPGIRPIRVLGRQAQISGYDVHASMNQVFRDQTRYLLLEVQIPAGHAGSVLRVAEVNVSYHDMPSGARARVEGSAAVVFDNSPAVVEAKTNRDVMVAVVGQVGAERNKLAMALRDAGKIKKARSAYLDNSAYLEEQARKWNDAQLQQDADANVEASENLEGASWKRERKLQQELQFKTQMQRAPMRPKDANPREDEKQKNP